MGEHSFHTNHAVDINQMEGFVSHCFANQTIVFITQSFLIVLTENRQSKIQNCLKAMNKVQSFTSSVHSKLWTLFYPE